ncbi:MAG: cobalamin biosynthesis protein CobD [Prevotella sp.]|nr:cobalamin biosynthesis protein CobD [Prevotella sp.]
MASLDSVLPVLMGLGPLLVGWVLDLLLGDPAWWPHPVVFFGRLIARGERWLNRGRHRRLKGGAMAITLVLAAYLLTEGLCLLLSPVPILRFLLVTLMVFSCLAGTTLIREVRDVFTALDRSLADGRRQVARIVGRDTTQLSAQEVRTAALETLAENLSDGVVAPLFWLAVLGPAGMMAYKMVNTLDSMIGYRTERYRDFGCVAARIDDAANWIPARLTALLMVIASGRPRLLGFVVRYGHCHASPNSGWPEAALAGILDCRFGGGHTYFGEYIDKPYIGTNSRALSTADVRRALHINRAVETMSVALCAAAILCSAL